MVERIFNMGGSEREPGLDDMLTDPVTQAVMASDGVAPEEVKNLLLDARRRYLLHRTITASKLSSAAAPAERPIRPAVSTPPVIGRRRG
jgi:hypothetical protein